ncbi:GNAT family N-acetyltransferase [Tellurirhabdus bombi]|uniref:GNAT family N-acetyltransferase n=1 Tax=Tellurirhabdus bombi TaxID=2907205 RepID=UPI001F2E07CA|nr:GNAT family N-acetyltransferase [Tellurirhabdus bombi]
MLIAETDRLTLSQISLQEDAFILELLNTPSWLQFIGDRGVKNLDDARNYLQNGPLASYERLGFGLYLVALKDTKTPIGLCGLIKRDSLEDVDLGFAFLPAYEGQGYGYEAASAVMNHARNTLNLQRIVAITLPDNQRSVRLLERLGLHFEKWVETNGESLKLFGTAGTAHRNG